MHVYVWYTLGMYSAYVLMYKQINTDDQLRMTYEAETNKKHTNFSGVLWACECCV